MKYVQSPVLVFGPPFPFVHTSKHILGCPFPPRMICTDFFFVSKTLHQHLSNNVGSSFLLKSYQTLNQWENSENNRRNIAFCFSYNVYKENARTFLQFICTWLEMHLIPRESSALRYFSLFLCLDFS